MGRQTYYLLLIQGKEFLNQQYLPDGLTDRVFYKPTDIGYEAKIKAHMDELHRDCDT